MNSVGRARCRSCRKVSSDSAKIDVRVAVPQRRASTHERSKLCASGRYDSMRVFGALADALAHVGRRCPRPRARCAPKAHHALGLAGGARGVDQHRQLVGRALRPASAAARCARRSRPRCRSRSAAPAGRRCTAAPPARRRCCCGQAVELADEQQAGVAVLEHEAHGVGGLGGEDRHRGVAAEPDRQLGHEEVRAVLRQDGDARAAREAPALQVRGHAARLVEHLAPGVVDDLPACRWAASGKRGPGAPASWSNTWSRISLPSVTSMSPQISSQRRLRRSRLLRRCIAGYWCYPAVRPRGNPVAPPRARIRDRFRDSRPATRPLC